VIMLTVVAGATNVLSLARLGGVPASIMTANLVLVGLSATRDEGTLGWHAGMALAGFAAGAFLVGLLVRAGDERRPVWPRQVTTALAAEALPLAGVTVGWALTGGQPHEDTQLTLCALTGLAMGIQSAAVSALGVTGLSSTFFTGTLTSVVTGLAGHGPLRWSRGATGLAALIAGAAAQGALLTYGQRLAPLLPLAIVCAVTALGLGGFSDGRATPRPSPGEEIP
jgi:uncharacterized membrane protein YoaK (UPF0700 family)